MRISVRGKNLEVTNALRQQAEKKLSKLDRYLDQDTEAQVTFSVERESHIVEVTIRLNGYLLRGEEATNDMYASIDLVIDKLERQLRKYKTKLSRKIKSQGLKDLIAKYPDEVEEKPELVRTKRFPIKPMPVEEAIMQMNMLGHSFFVFSNAESEQVNVVYRRKDGNYGLIEPEI
ncbi:MAG: ribosome-associated translation inhibitor RaiA [Clostridia bacterium]|jgi:putative sigma-54 modulation protein|nr:ribosome-associated translation inhibitor RaiA [Clostridia bacterium]